MKHTEGMAGVFVGVGEEGRGRKVKDPGEAIFTEATFSISEERKYFCLPFRVNTSNITIQYAEMQEVIYFRVLYGVKEA